MACRDASDARPAGRSGVPTNFPQIRLVFVTDGATRPVFWFRPSGDDLYWGPVDTGHYSASVPLDATTTIPAAWEELPSGSLKMSYHASGQVHLKASGIRDGDPGQLPPLRELTSPLCIGAVITKRADLCAETARSDERGGASAVRFHLDEASARRRHYFEFLVTPEGTFTFPESLLVLNPPGAELPVKVTQSVSPSTILAIRHLVLSEETSAWHPDKLIWIGRYTS